ncbi:uncharacterized protein HD556DRAFT_1309240 [Suillus plorans]|uniref:Uncharacterized protein n=1 Tax=Suillus plorans TaxID=116603 RepID=A0A9P7DHB2_9AGAM|nr:uncharacterized protein HD556DRAFT_1309240 [Suillus plorans]KAG1792711.1 hypothetical protein HD556DRAFT_1309240 [Suillus plorans]
MDPTSPSPTPTKFNFGWTPSHSTEKPAGPAGQPLNTPGPAAVDSERTPSSPAPTTFNFGWTRSIATEKPPRFQHSRQWSASVGNPSQETHVSAAALTPPQAPAAEHPAKFNFGWKQPPSTTAAVATHVGFDHNNKPFQFGCKVPPAKVGEWTPAPITAAVPQAAPVPMAIPAPNIAAVPEAAPAPESDPYTPKALPNWEGGFPAAKRRKLNPATEKAAIDIVKRLNGDEFDRLAQTMLGSLIRPGDDVRDPMPADVLTATALYYWRSLSFMDCLANEVETAERTAVLPAQWFYSWFALPACHSRRTKDVAGAFNGIPCDLRGCPEGIEPFIGGFKTPPTLATTCLVSQHEPAAHFFLVGKATFGGGEISGSPPVDGASSSSLDGLTPSSPRSLSNSVLQIAILHHTAAVSFRVGFALTLPYALLCGIGMVGTEWPQVCLLHLTIEIFPGLE